MYIKDQIKRDILMSLRLAVGKEFDSGVQDIADANRKYADLTFGVFELAKKQNKNPVELAREIAARIEPPNLIKKVEAVGPYVNFFYDDEKFAEAVLGQIEEMDKKYGTGTVGEGVSLLIEYAQPNTLKDFHIGHVRSSVYGQAVVNLARANGYKVIPVSYINDLGSNVAKILWWIKKKYPNWKTVSGKDKSEFLQKVYIEATQYEKEHEEAKEEISEVFQKLENKDKEWMGLWKETRKWSLDDFAKYFKELNVFPEATYYESDVLQEGKETVKKLLTEGIAKKSDGAVVVDLTDENLGVMLLLKSDGTSLYATRDLPLAFKKDKDFNADRQLFVVDVRQSLYFKQVFATLKKMGFKKELRHLAFDFVTLPDGAMSSRTGNVIKYKDLRDEMVELLENETRERHPDWNDKKIKETAFTIAIAALNFMMLRQDPESVITFDVKEAMSFDGFTGPYLLYTIARLESLQKKANLKPVVNGQFLQNKLELKLARALANYPDVIKTVGHKYKTSLLASWVFETAKILNEYYHTVKILDDDNKDRVAARLALLVAVKKILVNALDLLCIKSLREM